VEPHECQKQSKTNDRQKRKRNLLARAKPVSRHCIQRKSDQAKRTMGKKKLGRGGTSLGGQPWERESRAYAIRNGSTEGISEWGSSKTGVKKNGEKKA